MKIRTLKPLAVLGAVGALIACQGDLPTAAAGTAPEASTAATGRPASTGIVRGTFPDASICGIPAALDFFSAGPTWPDVPGGEPAKGAGSISSKWTANGKTLVVEGGGQVTREITEWLDPTTFVAIETHIGSAQMIKLEDGPVLIHDSGFIRVRLVIHLLADGTPVPVAPPEFVKDAGPHPEGDSFFTLFCGVVTDALS